MQKIIWRIHSVVYGILKMFGANWQGISLSKYYKDIHGREDI